ncbi:MAG TPA: SHOCT domain-containing protein [Gaiellaceae bacterium]
MADGRQEPGRDASDRDASADVSRTNGTDTVEQLERLAELREQGILTEEEFRAEKRRIILG